MKPALMSAVALAFLAGCASQDMPWSSSPISTEHTETCKATTKAEIAALFQDWNNALQSGDPQQVVNLYADGSILLPTVSNQPRLSAAEKADYFEHFMQNGPSGSIDLSSIELGCNMAVDAGLYSFAFARTGAVVRGRYSFSYRWDGSKWQITSHHSSRMPE